MPSIAKLQVDVDADTTGAESGLSGLNDTVKKFGSGLIGGVGKAVDSVSAGFAIASAATIGFGTSAFMTAARTSELNQMLGVLAKNSGMSMDAVNKQVAGIKSMGIETQTAQEMVAQFMRANLDSSKATDLARVAQDAAIVTGKNSTETLQEMLYAIQTGNSNLDIFAQMNIQGGTAVKKYADSIGKTTTELTQAERQQAIMNAFMEAGVPLAGAYASAMEQPGKVLRSFPRIFDDIKNAAGTALLQGVGPIILKVYDLAKAVDAAMQPGGALAGVLKALGDAVTKLLGPLTEMIDKATAWVKNMKPSDLDGITKALDSFTPAIAAAAAALAVFGGSKIPVIGEFIGMLPPWAAGLAVIVGTSKEGQDALKELLNAVMPLVKGLQDAFMPVLTVLMKLISDMIPVIMPLVNIFVRMLTDAILPLLPPILALVETALPPLVKLFSAIMTAIEPIILPLSTFIAALIDLAARVIPPLLVPLTVLIATLLPAMVRVFDALLPALDPIFAAIALLVPVVVALLDALVPLIPPIEQLAMMLIPVLTDIIAQLVPVLQPLIAAFMPLIPIFAALVDALETALVPILQILLPIIKPLADIILVLVAAFWAFDAVMMAIDAVMALNPFVLALIAAAALVVIIIALWKHSKTFRDIIHEIGAVFTTVFDAVLGAAEAVINFFKTNFKLIGEIILGVFLLPLVIVAAAIYGIIHFWDPIFDFFKKLPGMILDLLADFGRLLADLFVKAIQLVILTNAIAILGVFEFWTKLVPTIIGFLVDFGTKLAGVFLDAITALPGIIEDAAKGVWKWFTEMVPRVLGLIAGFAVALWNWAVDAIESAVKAIGTTEWKLFNWFMDLPGKIWGFISPIPGRMLDLAVDLITSFANGLHDTEWKIINWFKDVIPKIWHEIESLPGKMLQMGKDMIQGMIDGVESMGGALVDKVKEIATKPIDMAKGILHIGSPSKVFMDIGEQVTNGLAIGISNPIDKVAASMNDVINATMGGFGSSTTTVGMGAAGALAGAQGPAVQIQNVNLHDQLDVDQFVSRMTFLVNAGSL